ncbi:hypothetical protein FA15DRAFT_696170 [Coprinopsis marcescibilis]|uniref:Uncharacterized protein n=1 Tax=Coprinopsis marcescibilis TaxID=230819 RepID=A0A5C3L0J1_COPMA|nr:hypothetical protein FA15DRAFT_696170 [Coprinopsis marcescibilis]
MVKMKDRGGAAGKLQSAKADWGGARAIKRWCRPSSKLLQLGDYDTGTRRLVEVGRRNERFRQPRRENQNNIGQLGTWGVLLLADCRLIGARLPFEPEIIKKPGDKVSGPTVISGLPLHRMEPHQSLNNNQGADQVVVLKWTKGLGNLISPSDDPISDLDTGASGYTLFEPHFPLRVLINHLHLRSKA